MIKKFVMSVFAMSFVLISNASAKHTCENEKAGGYIVSDKDIISIKTAQDMEDDSIVTLQGQIEKRVKKDMYQFKDSTGTIMIEIGKKIWRGQTITAQDTVQITGEIDKDDNKTIIDVENLMKK